MACRLLDKLHEQLAAQQARVFVHSLRSEDNASDAASRGRKATDDAVENCFTHMKAQEEGHRITVPEDYLQRAGVNHEERDWDDVPVEDLLGFEELIKDLLEENPTGTLTTAEPHDRSVFHLRGRDAQGLSRGHTLEVSAFGAQLQGEDVGT